MESFKKMFINYFDFKDRITRKDFWVAILMNVCIF